MNALPRSLINFGAPRAIGLVFDWCVSSASFTLEPAVKAAQFGDGYAQRRPAGINTQAKTWKLELKNVTADVSDSVLAFLAERNGVEVFNWTPPRTTEPQDVICPTWSASYGDLIAGGDVLMNVQMTFQQVFQ
jgi:phage-related protein